MSADSAGFKSLTEDYETTEGSSGGGSVFEWGHWLTISKPQETVNNEEEKELALGLGLTAFIGMNSCIQDAFNLYAEGAGVFATLSALAMQVTTTPLVASCNINYAKENVGAEFALKGVSVSCTVVDKSSTTTSNEKALMHSALLLTRQHSGAAHVVVPGSDIAAI